MSIRIPDPCSEDWSKMTPTEKGAFCNKCAKEVIDFRVKTPSEIKSILQQEFQAGASVCGRIRQSQLDTLNDSGFNWQSEKQHFQTIWMLSIVAVFGLTLFSCQNTLSKEVVAKMNADAQEILAQNESDTLAGDAEIENKDKLETENEDPLNAIGSKFPWEIDIEMQGQMPFFEDMRGEITTLILIGDWMTEVNGMFTPPTTTHEQAVREAFLQDGFFQPQEKPSTPTQKRVAPRPTREVLTTRNNLIYNEDLDDFIGYIAPVPISEKSRIIIEVFRSIRLNLTLQNADTNELLGSRNFDFEKANYAFNPKFMALAPGNYCINFESENTRQSIQFSIATN